MKNKIKSAVAITLTALISLIILVGAILKLIAAPMLVDIYSKIGLLPYMRVIGVTEIVFLALFLWKPSMKIGFLLLTAHLGGAMAVELSHGTIFVAPAAILTLIWIAAYLRDATIFSSLHAQRVKHGPARSEVEESLSAARNS